MAKDSIEREKLERKLDAQMRDLNELRGDNEHLSDWPNGFSVYLDPTAPTLIRAEMVNEIMQKGGRITLAIGKNNEIVKHRFAVMLLGESGNWIGIGLMYFSKEFGELEMEAVKTRAKLIALKYKVKIEKIEPLQDSKREPDTRLSPVGMAENWDQVADRVKKFHQAGIVKFFAAAHPVEIQKGHYSAIPLDEAIFKFLGDSLRDLYPWAGRVALYINENKFPDQSIQKVLVAVPQPKMGSVN